MEQNPSTILTVNRGDSYKKRGPKKVVIIFSRNFTCLAIINIFKTENENILADPYTELQQLL